MNKLIMSTSILLYWVWVQGRRQVKNVGWKVKHGEPRSRQRVPGSESLVRGAGPLKP